MDKKSSKPPTSFSNYIDVFIGSIWCKCPISFNFSTTHSNSSGYNFSWVLLPHRAQNHKPTGVNRLLPKCLLDPEAGRNLLQEIASLPLSSDLISTTNSHNTTEKWLQQFKLKLVVKCQRCLYHPNIKEIIANDNFGVDSGCHKISY